MLTRVSRNAHLATSIALGLAQGALPVAAQTPTPRESPSTQPAPRYPKTSPETTERSGKVDVMEGSVKKVNPGAGTLQVAGGPLGIMSRTLEVGESTRISVDGHQGTLADIQEGTKVKAAYQARDGKNVATLIEVLPQK